GIVSAKGRNGLNMNMYEDFLQTDAAINPGNSGGPLLNLKGEAIGVNVAIVQGSQNIGFALPINDVRKVVDSVAKGGKISRPFLGVRYVMITKEFQDKNQLPVDHGALVARGQDSTELAVAPGSPADLAGIVENDIILEVDGKPLAEDYPLFVAVARHDAGDKVTMKILHKGQQKTVEVTLGERK
ncbi:MAG TPA: PDZ domain-containing protein, partial [Patescibacteria group bacterium]|nr:PDZ domain-containing protein [Patescibacteria group bacterium]